MKLKTAALALAVASTSLTAASGHGLCKEPVSFYSDCKFEQETSKVSIEGDHLLVKVEQKPKAVIVPAGCRVTLFSTTTAEFSTNSPSHGMYLKGPDKACVSTSGMIPVAAEIKHDVDVSVLVNDGEKQKQEGASMKEKVRSSNMKVSELSARLSNMEKKIEKGGLRGADGKDGRDGKDGQPGKNGKQGERGTDGKDGKAGQDGVRGPQGPKGNDGIGLTDEEAVEAVVRLQS